METFICLIDIYVFENIYVCVFRLWDNHMSCMCCNTNLILSTLLFMLNINDICNISNSLRFFSYLQITLPVSALDNADILYRQANIELKKLYSWFCLSKRYLNTDKTYYILFCSKQDDPKIQ